jgi:hypothetical protein
MQMMAQNTDLDAYRAALSGPAEAGIGALASVQGNLWSAAHPYEEHLVDARRRLAGDWLARARRLVEAGTVAPARLHSAAVALGLDAAELDGPPASLTA